MATASFAGPGGSSIATPATSKMTTAGSYLDIQNDGWAKQYLPELYEKEVERYGNRTVAGFLKMAGAEMPMQSDQVIWSEQGRLHIAYQATVATGTGAISAIKDIDNTGGSDIAHSLRVGNTVVCEVETVVFKGFVKSVGASPVIVPYGALTIGDLTGVTNDSNKAIKLFVYGSEFKKGTDAMTESVEPSFKTFTNKPMIIKDHFEINGSDTAQIGWVEVTGESGQGGYLWYLKASGDTNKRFDEYMEMTMIEAEKAAVSNTATANADAVVPVGSEGLLSAIGSRGIVATAQFDAAADGLADFDLLLKELDKQGAIEENMLFLGRDANLVIDDMLAGLDGGSTGSGSAYGVFNNSIDQAINLGFKGFRRGSYDFYKTDWKYLNDKSTRGNVGALQGVLLPAGSSSVYDQTLAANVRRPFLHVRYRASQADDRKLKTWVTGSVGGAATTGFDKMEIHYLSERCLVTQAANNFIRFDS